MKAFGGDFRTSIDSPGAKVDITHLVCYSNESTACQKLQTQGIKIIKPSFFDDSFRLRGKCVEQHYLFDNTHHVNSTSTKPSKAKKPGIQSEFLMGHLVCFDNSVQLKHELTKQCTASGASACEEFSHAVSIYITDTIEIHEYIRVNTFDIVLQYLDWNDRMDDRATRNRKVYISIFACIIFCNLNLTKPKPQTPIPQACAFTIGISGYSGQARRNIKKMAQRIGCTVTDTLTMKNTHLICCVPSGAKFAKAIQWNLHVVNHLWLEETYGSWVMQKEARPSYSHFPPGLDEMVNMIVLKNRFNCKSTSIPQMRGKSEDLADASDLRKRPNGNKSEAIPKTPTAPSKASKRTRESSPDIINREMSEEAAASLILDIQMRNSSPKVDMRPAKSIKIAFTKRGISLDGAIIAKLKSLQVQIVANVEDATYLIAPKIDRSHRTIKLLTALILGIPVLSQNWVNDAVVAGALPAIAKYFLRNPSEQIDLQESYNRTNQRQVRLLDGFTVYATPSVTPSRDLLSTLITKAGGQV